MPDFVPVLIAAVLLLIVLIMAFGGGFISPRQGTGLKTSRTIFLGEDFSVTYSAGEKNVASLKGEVSRGVLSGAGDKTIDFSVSNIEDISEGVIKLKIWNVNHYGNLIISINGKEIYKGFPNIGEKTISFSSNILESSNTIEVKAETSGWRFWAPTTYIFDLDVFVSYSGKKTKSFNFDVSESEFAKTNRARLLVFGTREGRGNLNVRLNGIEIYSGLTTVYTDFSADALKIGKNTLDLSTEPNTTYNISSAQIVLFFG